MNPEDRLRDAAHAFTEQIEPANDGWARIHEGIAAKSVLRTRRTWQLSLAGVTAAVAVALVVALTMNGSGGGSSPPVATAPGEPQRVIALLDNGAVVVMSASTGAVEHDVAAATPGTVLEVPSLSSDGRTLYYSKAGETTPCDASKLAALEPTVESLDLTARAAAPVAVTRGTLQLVSPDGQLIAVSRRATCSTNTLVVHNVRTGKDRALDAVDARATGWSRDSKLLETQAAGFATYDVASGHLVAGPVQANGLKDASGDRTLGVGPAAGGGVVSMATSGDRSSKLTYAEVLSASGGSSITGKTIKALGTYPLLATAAALDRSGSHLLLSGYTDHSWSELEVAGAESSVSSGQGTLIPGTATSTAPATTAPPVNDSKSINNAKLGLYAASAGKLRKIADGEFRWAQWLPDNVALPDTTNPTTPATTATSTPPPTTPPTTTTSSAKSVVLPVTGCPATFGTSTAPKPVVPTTVSVTISSADADALSGYSDGARTTVLAPKGWQCRGSVGANGSSAFSAAQTLTDNGAGLSTVTGTSVTVATTGTANGTAELLCAYFDIAKSKFEAITPSSQCPGLPAGVTITNRTDTVVRFRGTGSNGNVVMGAARLTPVHDAANPGEWGTGEVVRCELPVTDFHFCSTIVDTWLTIKQPKVG